MKREGSDALPFFWPHHLSRNGVQHAHRYHSVGGGECGTLAERAEIVSCSLNHVLVVSDDEQR